MQLPRASFLRDPITVPRREKIEHYRAQAARYRSLAAQQAEPLRNVLLDLGQECELMADALEKTERGKPMSQKCASVGPWRNVCG